MNAKVEISRKAVFLDRDATLNTHPGGGWVVHPDGLELIPGIAPPLKRFAEAGYLLIVITNQRGVALGRLSLETLAEINRKLFDELEAKGVRLDGLYFCPHGDEAGCDCRKPKPGMLLKAAREFGIDLEASWMLGDQDRDAQTAVAAGVTPLLVRSDERTSINVDGVETPILDDLAAAARHILGGQGSPDTAV